MKDIYAIDEAMGETKMILKEPIFSKREIKGRENKLSNPNMKKLYRASSDEGDSFDMEAKNKKEVEREIKRKGFEIKNWVIEKIKSGNPGKLRKQKTKKYSVHLEIDDTWDIEDIKAKNKGEVEDIIKKKILPRLFNAGEITAEINEENPGNPRRKRIAGYAKLPTEESLYGKTSERTEIAGRKGTIEKTAKKRFKTWLKDFNKDVKTETGEGYREEVKITIISDMMEQYKELRKKGISPNKAIKRVIKEEEDGLLEGTLTFE